MSSKEHQVVILDDLAREEMAEGRASGRVGRITENLGDEIEGIHDGADVSSRGMESSRPKVKPPKRAGKVGLQPGPI